MCGEPEEDNYGNNYFPAEKQIRETKLKKAQSEATILVVDDEEFILKGIKQFLTTNGYNVFIASNGREALQIYKKNFNAIDLILLDMVMPQLGGKETFLQLREINPDAKVILLSGYSIDGFVQEIIDKGGLDFIEKPFTFDKLLEKVNKYI